jgi:hypothetical protein
MYANILLLGRVPLRLRRIQESLVPFEGNRPATCDVERVLSLES